MADADLEGPPPDVGTYLFSPSLSRPLLTISPVVPKSLHCQHMGCPVLRRSAAGDVLIGAATLNSCTFAGLAATFAASSFRVCLRASWKNLSPPLGGAASYPGPSSRNAQAATLWTDSSGNPARALVEPRRKFL